jgi:diguanylate cyclase (GGDEF)-like protein/PAS domain S-box-containing protein
MSNPASVALADTTLPLLSLLVQGWPTPAALLSPHGGIVASSQSAEALLAVAPEMAERLLAWLPDALLGDSTLLTTAIGTGEAVRVVDWQAVRPGQGVVLAAGRDTTLERNLRQVLAESRQRFKDLVDISADFAWEVDADGRLAFVSPSGALGFTATELVNKVARSLPIGDTDELTELFEPREAFHGREIWLADAHGHDVCIVAAGLPLLSPRGEWLGARGLCRDVTESRERQAALSRAHQREQALARVVLAIRDEIDPDKAYRQAARATTMALTADGCRIARTIDRRGPEIVALFGEQPEGLELKAVGPLPADGTPVCADVQGMSVLAACTLYRGEINGLLAVWREEGIAFSAEDLGLMTGIARQMGLAHAHADYQDRLRQLSERDGMTGLYNRRTFMEKLDERLIEGRARASALLYFDLDNFKACNDAHGHHIGDKALMILADMLRDVAARGDLPARLGGDEFLIWVDNTRQPEAEFLANRLIQQGIEQMRALSGSPEKPLGMSIGIALHAPEDIETGQDLIAKADRAMYLAKKSGKNRFAIADQDIPQT